jgi:hypothetical protein
LLLYCWFYGNNTFAGTNDDIINDADSPDALHCVLSRVAILPGESNYFTFHAMGNGDFSLEKYYMTEVSSPAAGDTGFATQTCWWNRGLDTIGASSLRLAILTMKS